MNGAPWVVLDSRNDMLAMSSEVSESVIQYAGLPPYEPATTVRSKFDDDAVENVATVRDGNGSVPNTEEPQTVADAVTERELELKAVEAEQATVAPVVADEEIKSDDVVFASTTAPLTVSTSGTANSDAVEEEWRSKLSSDMPITQNRQNPNSVEEDRPFVPQVVVVSKKKYDMFNEKKSKYSRIRLGM